MDRERFILENPELSREQEKAGNRGILRLIAMISLGVSLTIGTHRYCNDEDFRMKVNDISEKLFYESLRQIG